MSLTEDLTRLFEDAFTALNLPAEYAAVRVSDRSEMAQFQCNGAMPAAKISGKPPRDIAAEVVARLKDHPAFKSLEIAGPGFINIHVTDAFLSEHVQDVHLPHLAEHNETIVLDYGGPNIAKSMHVGHLRTGIIGDTLRRILKAAGFNALGDIHMGDWGTHMGILMMDYIRTGEEHVVMDCDLDDPVAVQALFDDMYIRYPKASGAAKEDESLMADARTATLNLQNGEEPFRSMWQKIRDVSVRAMERNYGDLNVWFDIWKGEADAHPYIAPTAEKLKEQGFLVQDDGAWVIPVEKNDDKKKVPPLILYKRDGAVMYGSTDMATIVERVQDFNPARMIYIVDQRQSLHFEQVFRAVRLSGIVRDEVELTFAGVGTMNGTDGKPFKTRAGGVMRLADMIEMARAKALERLNEASLALEMSDSERLDVASKVGIAALKFADLQNQRHADYIFDLERMTQFEGKTGPYLLYQAVRIKSLLRKAGMHDIEHCSFGSLLLQISETERRLALFLTHFPDVFKLAVKNYTPHVLCDYAFSLAQEFSSFYGNCHILSEEDEGIKQSRLFLCAQTLFVLTQTLDLLGIETPERM
ncbi:MAG: arginine--tRNA ligase [Rhodospirillales bacterium]|nr:arginine--tRNA ligase [Rhodospirillales bacterium]